MYYHKTTWELQTNDRLYWTQKKAAKKSMWCQENMRFSQGEAHVFEVGWIIQLLKFSVFSSVNGNINNMTDKSWVTFILFLFNHMYLFKYLKIMYCKANLVNIYFIDSSTYTFLSLCKTTDISVCKIHLNLNEFSSFHVLFKHLAPECEYRL
jgi:hypothetical protein